MHQIELGLCVSLIPKTVATGDSGSFFLLPSHMRCASLCLLSGVAVVRVSKPQGLPYLTGGCQSSIRKRMMPDLLLGPHTGCSQ